MVLDKPGICSVTKTCYLLLQFLKVIHRQLNFVIVSSDLLTGILYGVIGSKVVELTMVSEFDSPIRYVF